MATAPCDNLFIYYLEGRISRPWEANFSRFLGNWEEEGYTFLFFETPATAQINRLLAEEPGLKLLDEFQMSYEEWQGGELQPIRIGRFLVLPPWCQDGETDQNIPPENRILLDPGVVFGNGTHPTTRDCLEALELAFSRHPIESALDLGTGTGLLALAVVKLGCRRCLAIDFNLLAARTALANVRLNGVENEVLVCQGRAEYFMSIPADLLIANIHFDIMQNLVKSEGFLDKKSFVLSGLLRSEAKQIANDLSDLPVRIIRRWERDSIWHTFYGERLA